jgi:hypothetical protein
VPAKIFSSVRRPVTRRLLCRAEANVAAERYCVVVAARLCPEIVARVIREKLAVAAPTMEGHYLVAVVDLVHVNLMTPETAGVVVPVAAEPNQVAVDTADPSKTVGFIIVQSSSRASDHESHSRNSWPMKIIGMPGTVKTSAAPRVERFCAKKLSALPGQISSDTRAWPASCATSSCDLV